MVLMASRFGRVAQRRAGAVGVDVVDFGGIDLRVGKAMFHRLRRAGAVFVGLRDVSAIGSWRHSRALRSRSSPRGFGVFEFFEHEDAGAFAEHKAIAVFIERPAGPFGCVVALRKVPAYSGSRRCPSA